MLVIFNPVAGRRRAHLLWRVLDVLAANGVRLELAQTQRVGHAETLARTAASRGEMTIVAAGGDGTIAEVANGLMGSDARLGIIPLGTANVLATELDLSLTPRGIAAALAFGRTRSHWPGLVRGPRGAWMFVQMLGVGFDAHIVHRLHLPLKRMLGRGAYVFQTLVELRRYEYPPIIVRVDDQETDAASVIVSKGRFYGGRYLLAADARPAEPGFSVLLFDRCGPWAALRYGAALSLDLLIGARGVRHIRADQIEFGGNQVIPAQSDGDAAGCTPLRITNASGPIRVVIG